MYGVATVQSKRSCTYLAAASLLPTSQIHTSRSDDMLSPGIARHQHVSPLCVLRSSFASEWFTVYSGLGADISPWARRPDYVFEVFATAVLMERTRRCSVDWRLCCSVSPRGKYIATGQQGENADVIIWDYATRTLKHRLNSHDHRVDRVRMLCSSSVSRLRVS